MKKLLRLRPFLQVILFFAILLTLFIASVPLDRLLVEKSKSLFFIAPTLAFLIPFGLWLYYAGFALNHIDEIKGKGNPVESRRYKIGLGVLLLSALLIILISNLLRNTENSHVTSFITLPLTAAYLYGFVVTIRYITKRLANGFHGREPKVMDYVGTVFMICIIPLGIAIFQYQIRTILKGLETPNGEQYP